MLSKLIGAVAGQRFFYYVTIGSILAGAGAFREHRLRRFSAPVPDRREDDYLPHAFCSRGRRLVFSHGIYVLACLSASCSSSSAASRIA